MLSLGPHLLAFAAIVTFLPPFLFVAAAFAISRALAMGDTARRLEAAAARLTHSDESAVASAQTLGRAIRRELDTLSTGLDAALGRLRALENVLEDRVAQLDDANARADVKTQAIAQRLREERQGIEDIAATLDQTAARASETLEQAASRASENLAGRAAQLKALMEQAGGELRAAGQLLDTQGAPRSVKPPRRPRARRSRPRWNSTARRRRLRRSRTTSWAARSSFSAARNASARA